MIITISINRTHEEVNSLKRKLERYKSKEMTSSSDEILLEEIRTYKVYSCHTVLSPHTHFTHSLSFLGEIELSML